jgi:hypothetical protein
LVWETSIDRRGVTLPAVEETSRALGHVAHDLRAGAPLAGEVMPFGVQLYLPDYVRVWRDTRAAVHEGVVPIVLTAVAIALLFVVSVARSWVEQRRVTIDLLVQRGVAPAWIALKATLELALPLLGFALVGWAVGIASMRAVGPSALLDASSVREALALTAALAAAGLVIATVAAAVAVRRIEQDRRRVRAGAFAVVAELCLLSAAGIVYARVVDHDQRLLRQAGGTPRIDVLHLVFPILLIVGAGAVAVRLLVLLLPVLRRIGSGWPVAALSASAGWPAAAMPCTCSGWRRWWRRVSWWRPRSSCPPRTRRCTRSRRCSSAARSPHASPTPSSCRRRCEATPRSSPGTST